MLEESARSGRQALPMSSPFSQCMLLLVGLLFSLQHWPSAPPVPPVLSKADFPHWQPSQGHLQPRTGGMQGRQGKAEDAREPASEHGEGVGFWPVSKN